LISSGQPTHVKKNESIRLNELPGTILGVTSTTKQISKED